jgi:hypothetical protein
MMNCYERISIQLLKIPPLFYLVYPEHYIEDYNGKKIPSDMLVTCTVHNRGIPRKDATF